MYQGTHHDPASKMAGRTKWVLAGFVAIALFFLLTEHRAHLFGALPYLLVFACPLMHLFHGHGHHGHGGQHTDSDRSDLDQRPPVPGVGHEPR